MVFMTHWGLASPITVKLRVAFRSLFQCNTPISWDTPVQPGCDQSVWLDLLQMLQQVERLTFTRGVKPKNVIGKYQLICFFHGSDVAFAAAIYIRWTLSDNSIFVSLLCAKSRVTPTQPISTPRSELNGAVIAMRLLLSSVKSLSISDFIPERVWMIGDSECTLASLEKVNAAF